MRIIYNNSILTAGDMSSATLTTNTLPLDSMYGYSIHAVYTGAPVGSLQLQGSNDGITWANIGSATAIGSAGNTLYNQNDCCYLMARCVYTKTSGTGSLTIKAVGKGV